MRINRNESFRTFRRIRVVASLADIGGPLEIVDVFRSPDAIPALVEELGRLPKLPEVFWLQPGAENSEAAEAARKLGMTAIVGDCIYADHRAMAGT